MNYGSILPEEGGIRHGALSIAVGMIHFDCNVDFAFDCDLEVFLVSMKMRFRAPYTGFPIGSISKDI